MTASSKFDYPPLKEVAFEITFQPKFKVIKEIADFQDKIAADYPIPGKEILSTGPEITTSGRPDELLTRFTFENAQKTRLMRVSASAFNIVWHDYTTFGDLLQEIERLWQEFHRCYEPFAATRIGLRYVNHLKWPLTEGRLDIATYTRPYFSGEMIPIDEIQTTTVTARLRKADRNLTIRSGIVGREEGDHDKGELAVYLLDYDCSQDHDGLTVDLNSQLPLLHETVESRFLEDVLETYKKYMRTGKWQ